jgi:hypothetical protein
MAAKFIRYHTHWPDRASQSRAPRDVRRVLSENRIVRRYHSEPHEMCKLRISSKPSVGHSPFRRENVCLDLAYGLGIIRR